MRIFYQLNNLPEFRKSVVTIGSFDGVHLGHQKILSKVKELAHSVGGESIVITFHPHPRSVIYPKDKSLRLINTIEERVALFEHYGIDNVVVVPFTVGFSQQSADEYIEKFLVGKFKPSHIVIGYDHRFGLNRQGNIDYLRWHADQYQYSVEEIQRQDVEAIAVSSTKIRRAIEKGEVQTAGQLLGHPFSLKGIVVRGQQIGHQLGYPTANLEVNDPNKIIPPNGIYAVEVIHNNSDYRGMLYIGDRPTLNNHHNRTIEVNIFEFDKEIYGDQLEIKFVEFIREDQKFEGLEALSQQLGEDKKATLKVFQNLLAKKKLKSLPPSVGIVILNYNGIQYLKKFLEGVKQTDYKNFTIVIADNGSTDESLVYLQENHPDITILDLKENHGFAGGYNHALMDLEFDYFVLLNSDIEVTPNWLDPLIETMVQDDSIAACQPKIRAYDQKDYFEYAGASGGWIDFLGYPFCRGRIFNYNEKDTGQYDKASAVFWATGAALLIKSDLFKRIGGFDARFFAHSEEIDLCWRLQRAGYEIYCNPQSVVYHVGGGTLNYQSPHKTFLNFRNSLFTLTKNESMGKLLWLIPFRLILDGLAGVLFIYQKKWPHLIAIIKAHFSYYYWLGYIINQRKKDQKRINAIAVNKKVQLKGLYNGSVVFQYFFRGIKRFSQLF